MNRRKLPDHGEDRITVDPAILVGKPVVRGTRIPVELVLAHLAENPSVSDLLLAYPRLTREDVRACLAFARKAVEQSGLQHRHSSEARDVSA